MNLESFQVSFSLESGRLVSKPIEDCAHKLIAHASAPFWSLCVGRWSNSGAADYVYWQHVVRTNWERKVPYLILNGREGRIISAVTSTVWRMADTNAVCRDAS